jgi:AraC-like DNA-binding protein
MDLLSDVLRDLRLESTVLSLGELQAPWGFDKSATGGAPFHVVIEGSCLLVVDGGAPIELTPGDLVVFPHGTRHALMSDPSARRVPFQQVLEANGHDGAWTQDSRIEGLNRLRISGPGPRTRIINGVFSFRDARRNPFVEALPTVLHARRPSWLEGSLRLLMDEATSGRPGFQTIAERIADIVFVQAVRDYAASLPANGSGWLRGLTDRQIAHALALVHRSPGDAWTVASLARELVGSGVMEYVTARRMHVAAGLLTGSKQTLADIANTVGYESEISFSKAFRRWAGVPPGQYRRSRHAPVANTPEPLVATDRATPLSAPASHAAAGRASPRRTRGTAPSAARTPRSPRPRRSAR